VKPATKLRAVPDSPSEPVNIYASWRAEIEARDWASVHVAADRREAIALPDPVRRWWLR
jgi:hypothetical protein